MRMRLIRLAVAVVSAIGLTVSVTAAPASAGNCTTKYCGGVVTNNSAGLVYVANDWCWPDRNRVWGNTLFCAPNWNSSASHSYFLLGHPDTTVNYSFYYDTDAFRVDAGCRMTVWDGSSTVHDNRGSSSPMWVKINNIQRISVSNACW